MVELGLLGDHPGDEEPAFRCRAPPEGRGEPGRTPGGFGGPRRPREGPPGGDPGGLARQGADVAGLPGGGGGAPHHGCGRQQLAPPGLAQRPHPLALPPAKPATAMAPIPTQAEAQVTAHTAGAGEWGGDSAPPWRSWAPRPTPPPGYSATERRAPPPVGGRAGATSARGGPLPRSPLTADRRPSRPPPASQRRAATAGGAGDPSEGLREGPALTG